MQALQHQEHSASFVLLLPTGNVERQQTQHFSVKDLWKLLARAERGAKGKPATPRRRAVLGAEHSSPAVSWGALQGSREEIAAKAPFYH